MDNDYSDKRIDEMVKPLFDTMAQRVTPEEMQRIHQAFELAREAHRGQKRKTGAPYIIHPIAVARIVGEEMQLGANPVCAAFLHDVVEDTPYTIEDIDRLFGKDIAFLVRVVTKQKKKEYEMSKQVDNFRQMLTSIQYDIRALLIKLADRLHNMRTLSSMRPDKQMKIAGETDFFYAPLANRLGLYRIKIELENLSFRYRCPVEYARLEKMLLDDRQNSEPILKDFTERIAAKLKEVGIAAHLEIKYRQPVSVRRKMLKTGTDFYHVENRHFVRVVFDETQSPLPEKGQALKIYAMITDVFKEKPGSVYNYIDAPKDNGYQSLHVKLLTCAGKWEEVHISSKRMRRTSTLGCIVERNEGNIRRWIEKLKSTLQDIAIHNSEINFMDGVTSAFYNDDIMVFTPKGDAINMPQRATALDFAFEIHNKVGLHAQYARINGNLCSVKTKLHRGDCIEIGTNPDRLMAQPEWLNHVVTYKAKRALNGFKLQQPKEELHHCQSCCPIPGNEVIGFKNADGTLDVHRRDCPIAISRASQDGDSVVPVEFKEDEHKLYPVSIHIRAVDRFHLLSDLIDCITNKLKLSIESLKTVTVDEIVDCDIWFSVHSFNELQTIITYINHIKNVDEVWKQEYVEVEDD